MEKVYVCVWKGGGGGGGTLSEIKRIYSYTIFFSHSYYTQMENCIKSISNHT